MKKHVSGLRAFRKGPLSEDKTYVAELPAGSHYHRGAVVLYENRKGEKRHEDSDSGKRKRDYCPRAVPRYDFRFEFVAFGFVEVRSPTRFARQA